jgi:tripartite-type tricarboxylate transporter receptor subunit TctC
MTRLFVAKIFTARILTAKILTAVIFATAAFASPANAQGFPSKIIRIIVPFTPGGSNDVVAREIAAGLQDSLKQSVVVENKPGGGGVIAYSFVAKSPPDGHTMLVAPASFTMGPHLSRNPLYHPVTEFAPVNLVADVPFVMVVPEALPARTVQEFIALAKSSPNKLTFGSVGVGTPQHFGGELFKMHAGVDLIHVPFRGATMVIPDLLAGRIDMFIGAINSLLPLIKEGKLRALAMAGGRRVASLPDVPTMTEAGLSGFEVGSGVGLVAPAGTPPDVVDTLNREIGKIIATPGYRERMAAIGVDVVGTTPAAYAAMIAGDYAKWGKVVAAGGIKPE